jgi:hypothetical protein
MEIENEPSAEERKREPEKPEEEETLEGIVEEVSAEAEQIRQAPETLIQETDAAVQKIIEGSGLSPAEIETAERETQLKERLGQNDWQLQRITRKTLDSIQALVELLAEEGISEEERNALFAKFGVAKEPFGRGAFYNVYELGDTGLALKELKLNYLFGPEEAVKMLARHEIEAERIREYFGEEFVPEFCFVYPDKHRAVFEKEKAQKGMEKAKLYDLPTFIKIQIDRRLQEGFRRRDAPEEQGITARAFQRLGAEMKKRGFFRTEAAGVMVQERVKGITFAEFFQRFNKDNCPAWLALRESVAKFLQASGKFNEKYAMLWHRFDSDNIMVETDEKGAPTGRIRILDLNFTERSAEPIRKKVNEKTEKKIWEPLRKAFDIEEEKED